MDSFSGVAYELIWSLVFWILFVMRNGMSKQRSVVRSAGWIRALCALIFVAMLGGHLVHAQPPQPGVLPPPDPGGQWHTYLPLVQGGAAPTEENPRVPYPEWRVVEYQPGDMKYHSSLGSFDFYWETMDLNKGQGFLQTADITLADLDEEDPGCCANADGVSPQGKSFDGRFVAVPMIGNDGQLVDKARIMAALADTKGQQLAPITQIDPNGPRPQFAQALVLCALPPPADIIGVVVLAGVIVWAIYEISRSEPNEFNTTSWQQLNPSAPNSIVPWWYPWDVFVNNDTPWVLPDESDLYSQAELDLIYFESHPKPSWWGRVKKDGAVRMPNPASGIPEPPDHVLDHPRDAIPGHENTSGIKTSAWINAFNAMNNNENPDGCFEQGTRDGKVSSRMVVFLRRVIMFRGGTRILGVAVIINHLGNGPDTAITNIYRDSRGRMRSDWVNPKGKKKNIFKSFHELPCPPPPQVQGWVLGY